jgi:hypothetical protein
MGLVPLFHQWPWRVVADCFSRTFPAPSREKISVRFSL